MKFYSRQWYDNVVFKLRPWPCPQEPPFLTSPLPIFLGSSMESISIFSSPSAGVEAGLAARESDSSTSAGGVPNGEHLGASVGMSFLTISSSGPGIIGRTSEDFGQ